MSRNVRSIVKLSWALRNLSTTRNHALSMRLFHSSPALERRFGRSSQHTQTEIPEKLSEELPEKHFDKQQPSQLIDCKTPDDIFAYVREYPFKVGGRSALHCLRVLYEASRGDPDLTKKLINQEEFPKICDALKKNIRQFDVHLAVTGLKYLSHFRVKSSTYVVQMLLQLIRDSVNSLSIDQIYFLQFLLKKMDSTPLGEALKIALPIVFTTQVSKQLDTGDAEAVVNSLQYMRKTNIDHKIIPKALNLIEKTHLESMTPTQAKQTLFCVLDWNDGKENSGLIPKLLDILMQKMDALDGTEMHVLLLKLSNNFEKKTREIADNYYNEAFCDACVGSVVSKDMGFTTALRVLTVFNTFGHVNIPLLDYIAAKCFENPEILDKATKYDIKTILYGLSLADYKPVFWDTMKEGLMRKQILDFNMRELIQLCLYFVTLDCYWPELLAKIFTTFEIQREDFSILKQRLLLIHYAVKNNYPEYKGPWPSEELIDKCRVSPNFKPERFELLKQAIECALGGPQYVLTNLSTKIGYNADHVAIMRKGGFPIAINNDGDSVPTKLDDLQPPPDSQVLLFTEVPRQGCPRNSDRLVGYRSLIIKQLELTTKSTVIPISGKKWRALSEPEQIRYISQAIRLKCDELSAVVN